MAGLAEDEGVADVGAGHEAERADQGGRGVGQDVAVQVGRQDDVVGAGPAEEFVDHAVDDLLGDGEGVGEGGFG